MSIPSFSLHCLTCPALPCPCPALACPALLLPYFFRPAGQTLWCPSWTIWQIRGWCRSHPSFWWLGWTCSLAWPLAQRGPALSLAPFAWTLQVKCGLHFLRGFNSLLASATCIVSELLCQHKLNIVLRMTRKCCLSRMKLLSSPRSSTCCYTSLTLSTTRCVVLCQGLSVSVVMCRQGQPCVMDAHAADHEGVLQPLQPAA